MNRLGYDTKMISKPVGLWFLLAKGRFAWVALSSGWSDRRTKGLTARVSSFEANDPIARCGPFGWSSGKDGAFGEPRYSEMTRACAL